MNTSSKYLTILLAVAALLLTTSCSNDDMDAGVTAELVSAQVTASINDGDATSRVTDPDATEFATDDVIHVVADESAPYYDYELTASGWSSDSPYYFQNTSNVSFVGWYADPSLSVTTDDSSNKIISIDTSTGQATSSSTWNQWDILVTPAVKTNAASPSVDFSGSNAFQHVMSKVTFTFIAGDGISNLSALTAASLSGLITDATFDTKTCAVTKGSTATESVSISVTGAEEESVTGVPVILVPQTFTGTNSISITVTYNGSTYTADLGLTELAKGYHYAFNVTINATGLTVSAAEIKDWTTTTNQEDYVLFSYTYTTGDDGVRSYIVYNEIGLNAWAQYVLGETDGTTHYGADCTLGADITLTEAWTVIGSSTNYYTGTFDGNDMTISDLTISTSAANQGLIGYLGTDGVVKDLTLENVSITSNTNYHGGVVGRNYGTVSNCSVSGIVKGSQYTGGVVGCNYSGGTITACHSSATVTGTYYVGGVVGDNNSGTVTNCYSTGSVNGTQHTGGVVGYIESSGIVTACYSTGTVKGTSIYTGGVVGNNYSGTVTACYSTGNVEGTNSVGGVAGNNQSSCTITACYATGTLTVSGYNKGGVVGNNSGSVTYCYYSSSTADYGIGDSSNSGTADTAGVTTKVDSSTTTWSDAASTMNNNLTDWQYEVTNSDPPLTLQAN